MTSSNLALAYFSHYSESYIFIAFTTCTCVIVVTVGISMAAFEGSVFLVRHRDIADVRVVALGSTEHHLLVVGIVVGAGVNKSQELLLQTGVTVVNHLVNDGLHLLY